VADFGLPDLLYERHSLFCDAGARLARRARIPHIVELNAPQAVERANWETLRDPPFAHRMEQEVLRSADRVVAVSAHLAGWAVEEAGCQRDRVRHVLNGATRDRAGDREGTRSRLGLNGLVIGFLGSNKPWHGLERIPTILEALPEATALVVGEGPVQPPAHPRIRSTGRAEPDEVPDLVSAMDVGIAPYPVGTAPWFCPLKLLDYRAQGVPAVATDIGDCAHLLRDGAGEVLSTDDPRAWAAAIRRQSRAPRVRRPRTWPDVIREAIDGWETLPRCYTTGVAPQRSRPA
jgi:glycosyltransferase involved in cell wall biosynthesis